MLNDDRDFLVELSSNSEWIDKTVGNPDMYIKNFSLTIFHHAVLDRITRIASA